MKLEGDGALVRAKVWPRGEVSDEALTKCPECSRAIERIISRVSVSTTQSTKSMLGDKNLKEKGFTKLVNEGDGKFRRTV